MMAVDWGSFVTGAASSLVVALFLWAVLPRGATLTKTHPITNPGTGEVMPDTWRISNTSAVPVRIVAAEMLSPDVFMANRPSRTRRALGKPVRRIHKHLRAPSAESGGSLAWRWTWRLQRWTNRVEPFHLPIAGGDGAMLSFDDEVLDTRRYEWGATWPSQVVPPGETLTLHLMNNRSFKLKYRRAGLFGVFERRSLEVFGYA